MLGNEIVAKQEAYRFALKLGCNTWDYFYCGRCGTIWGRRFVPADKNPLHHYYNSLCQEHGGTNDMLMPFEWNDIDCLSRNVMAYLILHFPMENIDGMEPLDL